MISDRIYNFRASTIVGISKLFCDRRHLLTDRMAVYVIIKLKSQK